MHLSSIAWVVVVAATSACLAARPDARIRPGVGVGVTAMVMSTPDAQTYTPDFAASPTDAAAVRAVIDPHVSYGWRRVELRFRPLSTQLLSRSDHPRSDRTTQPIPTLWFDLYVKVLERGRWHAGLGLESAAGGYGVATYAWSPADAASVTLRAVFGGRDGSKTLPRYNTQVQGQLSYVRRVGRLDVNAFVGGSVNAGDGDGSTLHVFVLDPGEDQVTFNNAAYAGLGVDWH